MPVYDYVLCHRTADRRPVGPHRLAGQAGHRRLANQFHYYRLSTDNRIVWGGYDAIYHFGRKVDPAYEDRPETYRRLAAHFFLTFPQLDDVRFSHRWAGAIDTNTRFCAHWGLAHGGRVAYVNGFTGLGVGAARFAADVCLDLLEGGRHRGRGWRWCASGRCRFRLNRWPASESRPPDGRSTGPITLRDSAISCCAPSTAGPWLRLLTTSAAQPTLRGRAQTVSMLAVDACSPTAARTADAGRQPHANNEGDDVGDTLTEGQKLVKGGSLTSNNGAYTLTLQDDGNLVLAARGHAVWSTGTNGQDVVRAEVQRDGNFVLYTPTSRCGTATPRARRTLSWCCRTTATWCSTPPTDRPGRRRPTPTSRRRRHPRPQPEVAPGRGRGARRRPPHPPRRRRRHRRRRPLRGPTPWFRRHPVGDRRAVLRRRQQVPEIADASGVANPDLIHPGQVLTIPD